MRFEGAKQNSMEMGLLKNHFNLAILSFASSNSFIISATISATGFFSWINATTCPISSSPLSGYYYIGFILVFANCSFPFYYPLMKSDQKIGSSLQIHYIYSAVGQLL